MSAGARDAGAPVRIAGVAEALPPGERVLWRGAPRPALLARHALHLRLAVLYFAATAGWWAVRSAPTLPAREAVALLAWQLLLGAAVVGLLRLYARIAARGAEYVVTSRRVVLRVGAVFSVVVNVPLALVASAGTRRFRDGSGEIVLALDPLVRISWWLLWPHVRGGRLRWPEPLLRGLDAGALEAAAEALRTAAAELPPDVVAAAVDAAREDAAERGRVAPHRAPRATPAGGASLASA